MNNILNDKNYNSIIENTDTPIFIDFYSPTCGPCQQLLSIFDQLVQYGEENNVLVLKCDISKNNKIANKYQIQSVPFTLIVDTKKNIKETNTGVNDKYYYFSLLEKYNPNKKSFFQKLFKK